MQFMMRAHMRGLELYVGSSASLAPQLSPRQAEHGVERGVSLALQLSLRRDAAFCELCPSLVVARGLRGLELYVGVEIGVSLALQLSDIPAVSEARRCLLRALSLASRRSRASSPSDARATIPRSLGS